MACKVFIIGAGMGNPATLTREATDALEASELIIGSPRLVAALGQYPARKEALIRPEDIVAALRLANARVASVVMSGDLGFFSGATRLFELLRGWDVHPVAGVTTVSYLCAKLQTTWQDACLVSVHGRDCDVVGAVRTHAKTFVLTGGATGANNVCAQLAEHGLGEVRVYVGERLSYGDERIVDGAARELAARAFDPLAALLVINPAPLSAPRVATPHLTDDAFARGKVPMTKEEVRELAICKLRIRPDDVVWDVGAGTGSVSVEAARCAWRGEVFAVERDEAALGLLQRNRDAFGLANLHVVAGLAPQALAGLPVPDRVFVGGTSGRLDDVLSCVMSANPRARVCASAITLETLSAVLACLQRLPLQDVDISQVSVAKGVATGAYHLMRAHNPVYLVVAEGSGERP